MLGVALAALTPGSLPCLFPPAASQGVAPHMDEPQARRRQAPLARPAPAQGGGGAGGSGKRVSGGGGRG